ncbi:MAG: ATP-binding cassette domain-containing protein [Deltaproteobacteria bacterium]|nr:ATP-binding cassette domain-containing protein [Deltaproteobacteria bacterium]
MTGITFHNVISELGSRLVLNELNLEIPRGEVSVILGRSGVGKSVLLKHVVGLLRPKAGQIWLDEWEVTHLSEEELWPLRRRCALVFQHPALLDSLTVEENIALGLSHLDLTPEVTDSRIDHSLQCVNLSSDIRPYLPHHLSFGMQKRVSIARAIALEPEYLLYDEPTTGLDPANILAIDRLIRHLSEKLKVTSVVVTHDIESALRIADSIALLEDGRVTFKGTADEFLCSTHPTVREFLKDEILRCAQDEL